MAAPHISDGQMKMAVDEALIGYPPTKRARTGRRDIQKAVRRDHLRLINAAFAERRAEEVAAMTSEELDLLVEAELTEEEFAQYKQL
jgi:hypothetical protein